MSDVLSPEQRQTAIKDLTSDTFDVVIVGGGVTGAGSALDAASRGMKVALIEANDWASGTSSRSSKLIHGGLRYLEQLDVALVREALTERTLMLKSLCPHLVRPVPFLFPITHRVWERGYIGAGIALYDTMAGRTGLPRHAHLDKAKVDEIAPAMYHPDLVGAIRYYDAQVDDARHTMTIVRTAAANGATVINRARAVGFGYNDEGHIAHVDVEVDGATISVKTETVVSATGVWTDDIRGLFGNDDQTTTVTASKGVHITVPADRIDSEVGFITRTATSVLFVIPWPADSGTHHWIIGTTDTPWALDKAEPAATKNDVEYLLAEANKWLRPRIRRSDIMGVFSGLRPLLTGNADETAKLSREHSVLIDERGLISVAGGKYTTYRVMAEDTIDAAVEMMGRTFDPSTTADIPLLGAEGFDDVMENLERLASDAGIDVGYVEHLARRYGGKTVELLAEITEHPELGRPIPGANRYLLVEAWYAAAFEGATCLEDVLARRTRIAIEAWDRGLAGASSVAYTMADVLGWDEERTAEEIVEYTARVAAERDAESMPDDEKANEVRTQ